jgi:hypothetical protein
LGEHHREADYEQGVMVDVGPGVGALIIYAGDGMRGQEIEISRAGHDSERVHTDLLRRRTARGFVYAAVFGSLAEGEYQLWHESQPSPVTLVIEGGQVTELDWR